MRQNQKKEQRTEIDLYNFQYQNFQKRLEISLLPVLQGTKYINNCKPLLEYQSQIQMQSNQNSRKKVIIRNKSIMNIFSKHMDIAKKRIGQLTAKSKCPQFSI